jgi:hypothetical protein
MSNLSNNFHSNYIYHYIEPKENINYCSLRNDLIGGETFIAARLINN